MALCTGVHAKFKMPNCSRTFTLAYHEHGLLYTKEQDAGLNKDVAMELNKRSGCRFEVSVMPRARIWLQIDTFTPNAIGELWVSCTLEGADRVCPAFKDNGSGIASE